MPVRFRCVHCQQLLGIARRKAGMEVRCPECHKMVLVPPEAGEEVSGSTRKGDILSEGLGAAAGLPAAFVDLADAPLQQAGSPAAEVFDAELCRIPEPARSAGLVLSPWQTILLFIAFLIILIAAVTAALLIGRYVL